MRSCFAFLCLIVTWQSAFSSDYAQNETTTYVLLGGKNTIVEIDRKSGNEKRHSLRYSPKKMVIHGSYGYIIGHQSSILHIVNLQDFRFVNDYAAYGNIKDFVIDQGFVYIICPDANEVTVIDLQTNKYHTLIWYVHNPDSIHFYKNKGYVTSFKTGKVTVIDLQDHTVDKTIPVDQNTIHMTIHGHYGFVYPRLTGRIQVIDLETDTLITTIPVGSGTSHMAIHGHMGYVVNEYSGTLTIIDLVNFKVAQTIDDLPNPLRVYIYNGMIVVQCKRKECLYIFDLKTHRFITLIPLDFCEHVYGFLDGCVFTQGLSTTRAYDLSTHKLIMEIKLNSSDGFRITDDYVFINGQRLKEFPPTAGYIQKLRREGKLKDYLLTKPDLFDFTDFHVPSLFSLRDLLPPAELVTKNCLNRIQCDADGEDILEDILASKDPQKVIHSQVGQQCIMPHLYLDIAKKIKEGNSKTARNMALNLTYLHDPVIGPMVTHLGKPVYLVLFDYPYTGINGSPFSDSEDTFTAFLGAVKRGDFTSARGHFESALTACHPKAMSIAAYAFLNGKWGAQEEDLFWHHEFRSGMDVAYYNDLVQSYGFCMY